MVLAGLLVMAVNVVLLVIELLFGAFVPAAVLVLSLGVLGYFILPETLNLIYRIGRVYWILRDTGKKGDKIVSTGWLRQAAPPWMVGHGIQIRTGKFVFQIGTYVISEFENEEDGVLHAMQGRKMDLAPKDLRGWQ